MYIYFLCWTRAYRLWVILQGKKKPIKKHAHTLNTNTLKVYMSKEMVEWLFGTPTFFGRQKFFKNHPSFLFNPFYIGGSMLPAERASEWLSFIERKKKTKCNKISSDSSTNLSSKEFTAVWLHYCRWRKYQPSSLCLWYH